MIVVDTDVVIDVLRGYSPALDWLAGLGDEPIVLPGFVALELIQGCANRAEQQRIERFLERFDVTWPSSAACDAALVSFSEYFLSHNLGMLDALIAHTAIEIDAPLVTFNQRHYGAITLLQTLQPYQR